MKLEDFELVINYSFKDQSHLSNAIQHKSFNKNINNERLEFLGDSSLKFCYSRVSFYSISKLSRRSFNQSKSITS